LGGGGSASKCVFRGRKGLKNLKTTILPWRKKGMHMCCCVGGPPRGGVGNQKRR